MSEIESLEFQSRFNEVSKIAESMEGDEGRYWKLHALWRKGDYAEGLRIQQEYEDAMEDELWKAKVLNRIGTIFYHSSNYDGCIEYCEKALELFQKLGYKHGEAETLYWKGMAIYFGAGDEKALSDVSDRAYDLVKTSYDISKEIDYRYRMGFCQVFFSFVAEFKGDIVLQRQCLNEALYRFKSIQYNRGYGFVLRSLGKYHYRLGEYEKASEYFEEGYKLQTQVDSNEELADALSDLVYLNSKIDRQKAEQYLNALQELKIDEESYVRETHLFAKIEYLKNSNRLKDKFQAMNLLENLLSSKSKDEIFIFTNLHLNFELLYFLLLEYQYTKENVVFMEIQQTLRHIISKAEQNKAVFFEIRAKLVKAQLEAIDGHFANAELILTEALSQAEKIGHRGVIREITDISKSMKEEFNEMKALVDSNASYSERLEKSKLLNYIDKAQSMLSGS